MFLRAQKNINYLYLHYDNFDVDIVFSVRRKKGKKCLLTFTYFIGILSFFGVKQVSIGLGGRDDPFTAREKEQSDREGTLRNLRAHGHTKEHDGQNTNHIQSLDPHVRHTPPTKIALYFILDI